MEAAEAAINAAKNGKTVPMHTFTGTVEHALAHIEEAAVHGLPEEQQRWYAIKLFERDEKVLEELNLSADLKAHLEQHIADCEAELDDDAESIITNQRYSYINSVVTKAVKKKAAKGSLSVSDKIDQIVTNRILALPIFAAVMFLIYSIAMGTSPAGLFEGEEWGVGIGTWGTDWANDGLFGDGWLYTNTEAYDAAVEEFEGVLETAEGAAAFEAGEIEEPDPSTYGLYHVGVPVVVGGWLEAAGAAPWVQSLVLDGTLPRGGAGRVGLRQEADPPP